MAALTAEDDEPDALGFGACASITQPAKKLNMLVMVIQNRNPNFRSFISPHNILVNKNTTVVGDSDHTALLQSIQKSLRLLDGLLICLDLRICLGKLSLKLLFTLLV